MKPEYTADGRKIVYPIWRDDLAEATILPVKMTAVPEVEKLKMEPRAGIEEWRAK